MNLNKNADIRIFSEKGEDIFPQISLEFAFTYRKANMLITILKPLGKR